MDSEASQIEREARHHLIGLKAKDLAAQWYEQEKVGAHPEGRWVDLAYFLDGSYVAPTASLGGWREDRIQIHLPRQMAHHDRTHHSGQDLLALWQCKAVMEDGGHVVYVHFEGGSPAGTIARLLHMGADPEMIRKQFHWPASRPWTRGEMAAEIERLSNVPTLAVLDGINAACGDHGWNVSEPQSVGEYRQMFVAPLVEVGCAVLSLGHPVKKPGRQTESYSYGAAG